MANPFILNALNVKPDYRQKRQDDINALKLQKSLTDLAGKDKADNKAALDDFGKVIEMGLSSSSGYLEPDAKRINDKFTESIKPVYEQLKKFHGNEAMFMANGGSAMLMAAMGKLKSSHELNQGIINKSLYSQSVKDMHDGKILNDMQDGTSYEDALKSYYAGERKDYPYNGSMDAPTVDVESIMKMKAPHGEGQFMSTPLFFEIIKASNPKHLYTDNEIKRMMGMGYFGGLINPNDPSKTLIPYAKDDTYYPRPIGTNSNGSNKGGSGRGNAVYQDIIQMKELANDELAAALNPSGNPYYNSSVLTGLGIYSKEDDEYGIIDRIKKRADGKYSVFVRNKPNRFGIYDDLWSLYSDAIRSSYSVKSAEDILNNAAKTASELGYSDYIGSPVVTMKNTTDKNKIEGIPVQGGTAVLKNGRFVLIPDSTTTAH